MALSTAIVLFLTGFLGDFGTRFVARYQPTVNLFEPFWREYGVMGAATFAGMLTLVFGGLFFLVALGIFRAFKLNDKSWAFIIFATAVGYILGMIGDVITNYTNAIPSLRKWYDGMGATRAGMWSGGFTFAFTAFIASAYWVYKPVEF